MRGRVRPQATTRVLVVGWSRRRVAVPSPGPILDLGSGAFPNSGADILCDGSLEDSRHRHGLAAVVDRPMVVARAEALPFRDQAFAFVIASHIAEHVDDPDAFCGELARAGQAGYVETPSPLADRLFEEEYHLWRVGSEDGVLHFREKSTADRRPTRVTDLAYRTYNAGADCARPTFDLPSGLVGRMLGGVLLVVRALLNRSGILHTRRTFGPEAPLRWRVSHAGRQRLTFISRPPQSGFVDADRHALESRFDLRDVVYPGSPTPRFVWSVVRSALTTRAVYGYFASEHMLVPAVVFRLFRRPVIVSVGGYDIAAVPAHDYGLAASRARRWLPAVVLGLTSAPLPISDAAADELAATFPRAVAKARRVHHGIDIAGWPMPTRPLEREGVVTVAFVNDESYSRKGIDRFVDLARKDSDRRYVLAGRIDPDVLPLLGPIPRNLEVAGYLSHEQLLDLLWSSQVYAQLSWHEAFGFSVLEALTCGCVPLVSEVPALMEVAGEWAVTVPIDDRAGDADAVRRAVERAGDVDPSTMRAWVEARFSTARRSRALAEVVDGLLSR